MIMQRDNLVDFPKVSIIIPLHVINEQFMECIQYCLRIDYPDYEIIVVSDSQIKLDQSKVQIIYTGKEHTGPGEKNDIAINECKGEICAFINDDVFPTKDWLKNAIKHFENPDVAAVGGPGITPENNNLMQKASGTIYSSILGGGSHSYRYVPRKLREVDDYPAYNLLVRKSILKEIGGFNSKFYGGEDTKLCLQIIKKKKKIIYDPTIIVYHHRRPIFKKHLKQVWNVGVHRGYFAKRFPETSRRISYFLPSIMLITFIGSIFLSLISNMWSIIFISFLGLYVLSGFISGLSSSKNVKIALLTSIGIPLTHLTYGLAFLRGLTLKYLER